MRVHMVLLNIAYALALVSAEANPQPLFSLPKLGAGAAALPKTGGGLFGGGGLSAKPGGLFGSSSSSKSGGLFGGSSSSSGSGGESPPRSGGFLGGLFGGSKTKPPTSVAAPAEPVIPI